MVFANRPIFARLPVSHEKSLGLSTFVLSGGFLMKRVLLCRLVVDFGKGKIEWKNCVC